MSLLPSHKFAAGITRSRSPWCLCTCQGTVKSSGQRRASGRQDTQRQLARRAALAVTFLPLLGSGSASQASVSSDLVEGTQNWLSIGRDSLRLWVQSAVDDVINNDETGITDLDNPVRRKRFGECYPFGLGVAHRRVYLWVRTEPQPDELNTSHGVGDASKRVLDKLHVSQL